MYKGFVKVAAAVPRVSLADCRKNVSAIESLMVRAEGLGVELICFPELVLTGKTCGDLFHQHSLMSEVESALLRLLEFSHGLNITAIVGVPLLHEGLLYNCAAVIRKGKVLGITPKSYLPNYASSSEKRWFVSGQKSECDTFRFYGQNIPFGTNRIYKTERYSFGIELGEDADAPLSPSAVLAVNGADLICNPTGNPESVGRDTYQRNQMLAMSGKYIAAYVTASAGYGESSQDMVFGGNALICENGKVLAEGKRFTMDEQLIISEIDVEALRADRLRNTVFADSRSYSLPKSSYIEIEEEPAIVDRFSLTRKISAMPFVPEGDELVKRCEEILSIQSEGLARRIEHTHSDNVVLGISGGLDSTLALLVCVNAFDRLGLNRKGIIGVTMPGFGTTDRTYNNAQSLMKGLGITIREISIKAACEQHFSDIGHDASVHDITFENAQARERTQILMDVANQVGGFVVGTGDLSELALGWATYNGDQMSMYGVNASVPKTLIRHLVKWVALNLADDSSRSTLLDIIDTPISPELIPADEKGNMTQKTEDLVGPYELHDFFLYYTLRYGFSPSKIFYLARHAFDGSTENAKLYSEDAIKHWITVFFKRFFTQQFKRSCLPDGPMVGSCSLSPRAAWQMPTDALVNAWLEECGTL